MLLSKRHQRGGKLASASLFYVGTGSFAPQHFGIDHPDGLTHKSADFSPLAEGLLWEMAWA